MDTEAQNTPNTVKCFRGTFYKSSNIFYIALVIVAKAFDIDTTTLNTGYNSPSSYRFEIVKSLILYQFLVNPRNPCYDCVSEYHFEWYYESDKHLEIQAFLLI